MSIESQVINATGKTIVTVNAIPDTNYLFPVFLIIATFAIAIATILTMKTSNKKQDIQIATLDKQNKTTAMLEVFKMLNNDTHKNAESVLMLQYSQRNLYDGQNIRYPFGTSADIVSMNYDQIGLIAGKDWIPKDGYFEMFGKLTIVYHHILFMDTNNRRTARGETDFRTFFTKLAIDCYEYWEKRKRIPFDPLTGQAIPSIALQQWQESLPNNSFK